MDQQSIAKKDAQLYAPEDPEPDLVGEEDPAAEKADKGRAHENETGFQISMDAAVGSEQRMGMRVELASDFIGKESSE